VPFGKNKPAENPEFENIETFIFYRALVTDFGVYPNNLA
jgi:hypothetical protein